MARVQPACWACLALSWDESRALFEEVCSQFDAISNILLS